MEGLTVFRTQRLIRSGTTRTNDGEWHIKSTPSSREGVTSGTDFGHSVDAKVGILNSK